MHVAQLLAANRGTVKTSIFVPGKLYRSTEPAHVQAQPVILVLQVMKYEQDWRHNGETVYSNRTVCKSLACDGLVRVHILYDSSWVLLEEGQ